MNNKKVKMLRDAAQKATVGKSEIETRIKYKNFKETYKILKKNGFNAAKKEFI